MAKNGRRTSAGTPDYFLLAALCILLVFGLAMLSSASSGLGKQLFNNSYYYLEHQLEFGLTIGLVGFLVGYFVPYYKFKNVAFILLLISMVALVLVFTPLGTAASGSTRWLRFDCHRVQYHPPNRLCRLV